MSVPESLSTNWLDGGDASNPITLAIRFVKQNLCGDAVKFAPVDPDKEKNSRRRQTSLLWLVSLRRRTQRLNIPVR